MHCALRLADPPGHTSRVSEVNMPKIEDKDKRRFEVDKPGLAFSDLLAHVKNNKTFVVEEVLFSSDSCNFTMFTVASLFPSHVRRLEWVAWRSPRASGLLQATGQCEVSGLDMLTNPGNPSRAWPDLWWHAWYIRINLQDVGDIDWYLQTGGTKIRNNPERSGTSKPHMISIYNEIIHFYKKQLNKCRCNCA